MMKTFLVLVFCLLVIVHVCDGSTHRSKKQSLDECNRKSEECHKNCDKEDVLVKDLCTVRCAGDFYDCQNSPGMESPPKDPWTRTASGCPCYFEKLSTECACCNDGGCQCSLSNLHQCVQCDHGEDCGRGDPAVDVEVEVAIEW